MSSNYIQAIRPPSGWGTKLSGMLWPHFVRWACNWPDSGCTVPTQDGHKQWFTLIDVVFTISNAEWRICFRSRPEKKRHGIRSNKRRFPERKVLKWHITHQGSWISPEPPLHFDKRPPRYQSRIAQLHFFEETQSPPSSSLFEST